MLKRIDCSRRGPELGSQGLMGTTQPLVTDKGLIPISGLLGHPHSHSHTLVHTHTHVCIHIVRMNF